MSSSSAVVLLRVSLRVSLPATDSHHSFFPPQHIDDVGTVQDAGLLENDPLLWALSEVSALFPFCRNPDFVVSLGTGEPAPRNYDTPAMDRRSRRKRGMLRRTCDLLLERTRDKPIRRACKTAALAGNVLHRIHRLSVDFDGAEPRLDDTSRIPELIRKAQTDPSLSPGIDAVARCMVASLFYFELDPDSPPRWCNGKYLVNGRVRCSIRRGDAALEALLRELSSSRASFLVGNWAVPRSSYLGKDGNFCIDITLEAKRRFAVTLKLGDEEEAGSNISGSPFSVPKLVAAQRLDAPFGHPDHRKRRRGGGEAGLAGMASKRRRTRP